MSKEIEIDGDVFVEVKQESSFACRGCVAIYMEELCEDLPECTIKGIVFHRKPKDKYLIEQAVVVHTYSGRVRHATKKELATCEDALNKSKQLDKSA